jgi:DNA-3-methyladenine glycosylase
LSTGWSERAGNARIEECGDPAVGRWSDSGHHRTNGDPQGHEVTRGPGNLCKALAIDLELDGWDLTKGRRLWTADHPDANGVAVSESPRINVGATPDLKLRFFITGNPYVSKSRENGPEVTEEGMPKEQTEQVEEAGSNLRAKRSSRE